MQDPGRSSAEDKPGRPPPTSERPFAERSKEEWAAALDRIAANVRFLRAHGHLRMKVPPPKEPNPPGPEVPDTVGRTVRIDPFAMGVHNMDERELEFALTRYVGFRREARRRLRWVTLRNYACGTVAFFGFWLIAGAPLLLLPILPAWIVGLFTTAWTMAFLWLVTTHPTLAGLAKRWEGEQRTLEFDVETHQTTISLIRSAIARGARRDVP